MTKYANEYWRRVCETDAAWDEYCRYPSDSTWQDYVETREAEEETEGGSDGRTVPYKGD